MNNQSSIVYGSGRAKKAIFLALLMLIMSSTPLLNVNLVSAHENGGDTVWQKQGSNDTGWVQLDAVGG